MSSTTDKLRSFDSDIRYMGLEDLDNQIIGVSNNSGSTVISPDLIKLAISLIGDTNFAVQNRAINLIENLSKLEPSNILLGQILSVPSADSQRGLALRKVFKAGCVSGLTISNLLSESSVWLTCEGCDAAFEYISQLSSPLSESEAEKFVKFYLIQNLPPKFSHGFDILGVCLPLISDHQWLLAKKVILSRISDIHYLSLVTKLAENSQRLADFELPVAELCYDVTDSARCETAVKALTAMITFNQSLAPKYGSLATNLINHREVDEHSGVDDLGTGFDSDDGGISDSETEMLDESLYIRAAACHLAGAISDANTQLAGNLLSCLIIETTEQVRSAVYTALTKFNIHGMSSTIIGEIKKDIQKKAESLITLGFKLFIHHDMWAELNELVEYQVNEDPSNVAYIVNLINGANWGSNPHLDILISQFLRAPLLPTQLAIVLEWISSKKLSSHAEEIIRFCQNDNSNAQIKSAVLNCISSLDIQTMQPAIVESALEESLIQLREHSNNTDRYVALNALYKTSTASSVTNSTQKIAGQITALLHDDKLDDKEVKYCYHILLTIPIPNREAVRMILGHRSKPELKREAFTSHIEKCIEHPVIIWAMDNHALSLISGMASRDFRVLAWTFSTNTPEINAAAAKGCSKLPGHEGDWKSFCDFNYSFTKTKFEYLKSHELEFLRCLGLDGIDFDWYSLNDMVQGVNSMDKFSELHSIVLGHTVAKLKGDYIKWFEAIANSVSRNRAFKAFTEVQKSPEIIFDIIKAHPIFQKEFEGRVVITDSVIAAQFAEGFKKSPQFLAQTAKYLDISIAEGMNSILAEISCDSTAEGADRCQALSILKCTAAQSSSSEYTNMVLDAVLSILPPNPALVKKTQIGPFKMDVDELEPARTLAIDCLGILDLNSLATSLIPKMSKAVSVVIQHNMKDPLQKTKIVAYRLIHKLLKDIRGKKIISSHLDQINVNIENELQSKPKANGASWVLEEFHELQMVVAELKVDLSRTDFQ